MKYEELSSHDTQLDDETWIIDRVFKIGEGVNKDEFEAEIYERYAEPATLGTPFGYSFTSSMKIIHEDDIYDIVTVREFRLLNC